MREVPQEAPYCSQVWQQPSLVKKYHPAHTSGAAAYHVPTLTHLFRRSLGETGRVPGATTLPLEFFGARQKDVLTVEVVTLPLQELPPSFFALLMDQPQLRNPMHRQPYIANHDHISRGRTDKTRN